MPHQRLCLFLSTWFLLIATAATAGGLFLGLTIDEALDVTRIYSICDMLPSDTPLIQTRPFRSPHHTVSHAGLVGGGRWPSPGEISLSHRGILFSNSRQNQYV